MQTVSLVNRNRRAHVAPKFRSLVDMTMKVYNVHLLPTDKDGGMAAVKDERLVSAVAYLFVRKSWHKRVEVHDDNLFVDA